MFSQTFLMLTLSAFLGGGGLQGVVVKKFYKPMPGIYRLELRDAKQKTFHQLVSAEIFAAYEVGDQFSDRATPKEIRRQHLVRQQAKPAVARVTKAETKRAIESALVPANSAQDSRLAQLFRKQDMLPETEGF